MYVEVELNGFKGYIEDYIRQKEVIEGRSGGQILVKYGVIGEQGEKEPIELIENRIKFLEELIKQKGDVLRERGIKYLVIMSLGAYAQKRPNVPAMPIGISEVLLFYRKKPKLDDVRAYP